MFMLSGIISAIQTAQTMTVILCLRRRSVAIISDWPQPQVTYNTATALLTRHENYGGGDDYDGCTQSHERDLVK